MYIIRTVVGLRAINVGGRTGLRRVALEERSHRFVSRVGGRRCSFALLTATSVAAAANACHRHTGCRWYLLKFDKGDYTYCTIASLYLHCTAARSVYIILFRLLDATRSV